MFVEKIINALCSDKFNDNMIRSNFCLTILSILLFSFLLFFFAWYSTIINVKYWMQVRTAYT